MAKVLVVDDDTVLTRLYKSFFEHEGLEVEIAGDGEEGFEKAKTFNPDLILSDIMMPRMDGLAFLGKLKEDKSLKKIPVIVMTNLDDEENVEKARKLGAIKHLKKGGQEPKAMAIFIKKLLSEKGVESGESE